MQQQSREHPVPHLDHHLHPVTSHALCAALSPALGPPGSPWAHFMADLQRLASSCHRDPPPSRWFVVAGVGKFSCERKA